PLVRGRAACQVPRRQPRSDARERRHPHRGGTSEVEDKTRAMQELATATRRRVVRDLEAVRGLATRYSVLPIVFFLFLASLFLFTNVRVNRDFFYVAVLPLGLLLLPSLQPGAVLRTS